MLLSELRLEDLTPVELWGALDAETRRRAAELLYRGDRQDVAGRHEADRAIASALHFRELAVRKLPTDKRVDYLLRSVRPDDSLVSTLLLALHLEDRVAVLEAFLDELGIPQRGGMIDDDYDLQPPDAERLGPAVDHLFDRFTESEVEVYLTSLIALDPDTWGELVGVLEGRRAR